MPLLTQPYTARYQANRKARQAPALTLPEAAAAQAMIAHWPGYRPTPLHRLGSLAARAGLGTIWLKDEGGRFGLGSFKALGGGYAVLRLIQAEVARATDVMPSADEVLAGRHADIAARLTVTAATDGNHGRAVAWGARLFGAKAVIFIHETVSPGRKAAIESYGATVIRTPGNYDDAVRHAAETARVEGWHVVSDTSWPGYAEIPGWIMAGYTTIVAEAARQLGAERPTHVFVQGGVGGLAAATATQAWTEWAPDAPRLVVVEPEAAACLLASAEAGQPTAVTGSLDTVMAGLACGEISALAWEFLERLADDFMAVPDAAAIDCMRLLARERLVIGESGVAGLAGLLIASADGKLGLGPGSRVLLIGSEGATDPVVYRQLVGKSPADVEAA